MSLTDFENDEFENEKFEHNVFENEDFENDEFESDESGFLNPIRRYQNYKIRPFPLRLYISNPAPAESSHIELIHINQN